MIHLLLPKKKFFPSLYAYSIYDVDYNKLYAEGFRLILTDLDNTLISYKDNEPNPKLFVWKEMVEAIGFEIVVVSNSQKPRVKYFCDIFNVKYVHTATKPLKRGYKKALKLTSFSNKETIFMGDQLMTDIFGSNRVKLHSVLIKAIDKKTERLVTKINRYFELKILAKIRKKYPQKYKESLEEYYENNF